MPTRRLLVAIAAAALALVGLLPASALAADGPDVTGTVVTAGGTPLAGATIYVTIAGNDMVWSTTSDASGAWAVTTGVQVGQTLNVNAMLSVVGTPDPSTGCVGGIGLVGSAELTVDALPVAPIVITVAPGPSGEVCGATATPRVGPTPPPTDTGTHAAAGYDADLALLGIGVAAVVLIAVRPARRPARRR